MREILLLCIRNELWNVGIGKATDTHILTHSHIDKLSKTNTKLYFISDVRFGPTTKATTPSEWSVLVLAHLVTHFFPPNIRWIINIYRISSTAPHYCLTVLPPPPSNTRHCASLTGEENEYKYDVVLCDAFYMLWRRRYLPACMCVCVYGMWKSEKCLEWKPQAMVKSASTLSSCLL